MVETNNKTLLNLQEVGGLAWLGVMLFISIVLLGYLGIWGFHNSNIKVIFVVSIFGFLLITSVLLALAIHGSLFSKVKNDEKAVNLYWRLPSLGFLIGFVFYATLVSSISKLQGLTIFSIQKNALFATFSSELPLIGDFAINAVLVPIIEEVFWIYFIVQSIFLIFHFIGKWQPVFDAKIVKLTASIIVSASTFAIFHVGKQNISFILTAIFFRTFLILLLWGEFLYDFPVLPSITMGVPIGIHIGNNWASYGVWTGVKILMTNVWGWMLLVVFAIMALSGLDYIFDKFKMAIGGGE